MFYYHYSLVISSILSQQYRTGLQYPEVNREKLIQTSAPILQGGFTVQLHPITEIERRSLSTTRKSILIQRRFLKQTKMSGIKFIGRLNRNLKSLETKLTTGGELEGQSIKEHLDTCAGDQETYQDWFDEIVDDHQTAGEPEYMEISARSARIQGQARVALEALSGGLLQWTDQIQQVN